VAASVALLAGCAQDAPQDTWQPAGTNAQTIDDLQKPIFYVAGVVGLLVFAVIGYVIVRYRDRGQPIPEQSHGNPAIEITLTIIPAVILATIGVFTVRTVFDLAETDDTEMIINVTGQQWWWEYDYPVQDDLGITSPIITSGQLVFPTDTNVILRITSRDVIHSYWIPALNGKKDAVPGRVHELRMQADEPGIYEGQCTEFCGLSHANMRMEAVALDRADFDAWVAGQLEPVTMLAEGDEGYEGQQQFISQCSRCHQVNGLENADGEPILSVPQENVYPGAAPNLTHLMSRNTFAGAMFDLLNGACRDKVFNAPPDEVGALYLEGVTPDCLNDAQLRAWLRNAPAQKPMYTNPADLEPTDGLYRGMPYLGLNEEQIDVLVEYLLTLK
jgi:cytochrome c oxidase subunit 2